MPRKQTYTLRDFTQVVDRFILACEQDPEMIPDDYTFCRFAHMDTETLDFYRRARMPGANDGSGKTVPKGFDSVFKKLVDYRVHWYSRYAMQNPRLTSFCALSLRQPCNGGWSDRPSADSGGTPTLNIRFCGAGENPFD